MTLPMPEKVTVALLKGDTVLDALHSGRVSTDLLHGGPACRVALVADLDPTGEWWQPMLQVECWADDQADAGELAAAVKTRWPRLGKQTVAGARVSGTWITQGPVFMPDPHTDRPRYLVTVALHIDTP